MDRVKTKIKVGPVADNLSIEDVANWPKPEKYERYRFTLNKYDDLPTLFRALEALKDRPDVDDIELNGYTLFHDEVRARIMEIVQIFNRPKRYCEFFLDFRTATPEQIQQKIRLSSTPTEFQDRLRQVFHTFKDAKYLTLGPSYPCKTKEVLEFLPQMDQLEVLDCSSWCLDQTEWELCVRHPLAAQMIGLEIFEPDAWPEPVFSSGIDSSHHDATLHIPRVSSDKTQAMVSAITSLPALDKLKIIYRWGKMHQMAPLLEWLGSPQCKVTSLALSDERSEMSSLTLDAISKMPYLKTLALDVFEHSELDSLLQAVKKSRTIDTIFIASEHMETMYDDVFDFQMECRPRRLMTQVSDVQNTNGGPEKLLLANKSHIVSLIYEFVDDFERRFAPEGRMPLSLFPLFLDKLNRMSTDGADFAPFDEESEAKVRSVCPEIAFGFLQQLLGDPHRLLAARETSSSGTETVSHNASGKRESNELPPVVDDAALETPKKPKLS